MRIEPEIWEKIDRGLVRIYRAKDIETQGRVMMELIMELVPADSVLINCFEVATGCYTARIIPEETATAEDVEELKPYLHESPFPAYHLATGDPRWKITTDFMPLEDYRATALYRSMQRWKVEIQMCAMLAFVDGTAHTITVNRSSGRFEESEREILDILHPHLGNISYLHAGLST